MPKHSSAQEIISERACAAYSSKTGRILHIHRVISYEGGGIPSDDALRAAALEHHKTLSPGKSRPLVETLIVDPAVLSGAGPKVDLKTKRLVRA